GRTRGDGASSRGGRRFGALTSRCSAFASDQATGSNSMPAGGCDPSSNGGARGGGGPTAHTAPRDPATSSPGGPPPPPRPAPASYGARGGSPRGAGAGAGALNGDRSHGEPSAILRLPSFASSSF